MNLKRYPKLLVLMLIVAVAGLSLLFASVYSEVSRRIRADRQMLMTQTADFLAAHIDEWLDKNIRVLKTAAIQPQVMAMTPASQTKVLQAIAQEYPWIYLAFTLDREGNNIARSDHGALTDYSDREYFKILKKGRPLSWQTLIGKTSHRPALVLALPIFRNGIFSGVIAAAMTTESISRSVADWQLGVSGFAYLMDEQNKVIAHPKTQFVLEERRVADPAFPRFQAGDIFSYKDEKGIAKISTIRKNFLGWRLVLEQEKKEAFRELYKFQKFMILICASMVIMVLGIAWLVARISVTPVIRMIDAGLKREKDLENRLQKVRKMEALGTFAGGIAHDFNNILGAISTCSEMAIDDVDKTNPAHEDLRHILRAATRGKKLVKQILEYSRSRNTRHKPVKLHRILLECLDLFNTFKPDRIHLEVKVLSRQYFILADPTQIHQVIMNLLLNAEHAMSGTDGTLTITQALVDTSRQPVAALAGQNGGPFLYVSVADTGCGMEKDVLERMFDPFYTTHMNTGGTGLGLAMSDVIIRRHKGVLFAESQVGKGTVFHVYLPCMGEAKAEEEEIEDEPVTLKGSEHVLFVDDDPHMTYSGKKMLSRLGYEVSAAENARKALALFRSDPERFDLVITDRVMPEGTGVELAHHIRQIRPKIPIILCSGFFNKKDDMFLDEPYDLEGLIDETVSKPYDIKGMSMIIRQVLDRRDYG